MDQSSGAHPRADSVDPTPRDATSGWTPRIACSGEPQSPGSQDDPTPTAVNPKPSPTVLRVVRSSIHCCLGHGRSERTEEGGDR